MDINFELYKIFFHAAKANSFSDAAQNLYISQSAVSQAIKNLEAKLGGQLFYRKARSVKLTPEGELLYNHISQAFNFIKTAESKLYEIHNMDTGEIRIGVSDTVCKYYLIPYLERFNKEFPKIKIQVINRTSSQILDILKNGLIDFGIVTMPVKDKGFSVKEFMTVEDIFVSSDKYPQLRGRSVSLKELSSYPLLMLQKDSSTRKNLDTYLNKEGIAIVPEIELESIDLLVEFARIGLGIAHVLKESAEALISRNELFRITTNEPLPGRKLGIVTILNVPPAKAAMEFIEMLNS